MSARGLLELAAERLARGEAWADLPGDALAFALAGTLVDRAALIVVDEPDSAERLARGLRFFLADPDRVMLFPADDTQPYDGFSPAPQVPVERMHALHRVAKGDPVLVVAPVRALLQVVPDAETRTRGTLVVQPGDRLDRDALVRGLTETGYLAAGRVEHPGTFSVRGDLVDVWSAGMPSPRRVDFFDDEVETLVGLDAASGKVTRRVRRALFLPAREERVDDAALRHFQAFTSERVLGQPRPAALRKRLLDELRAGIRFSGIEDHLPALGPTMAPMEAFGKLALLVVHPQAVSASARDAEERVRRRYTELGEEERPLVTPQERYLAPGPLMERLAAGHPVHELSAGKGLRSLGAEPVEGLAVRGTALGPVAAKLDKLATDQVRVALVAPSARRAQMMEELFVEHGLRLVGRASPFDCRPGEVSLLVGDLPKGFIAKDAGWAFVPASALFGGGNTEARRRAHELFTGSVAHVGELKPEDLVVHRSHGVGRFLGLVRLDMKGAAQDFAKIAYRDGDLLYVPATALDQLSVYTASKASGEVRLDKLGGATWAARRGKVRDSLLAMAQEMLGLHARRELADRPPHPDPGPMYRAMVARFPYAETPDQAQAILDVQEDLSGDHPMDRLVCGDVGFGKTEVALRATMRVVEGGQQVAILCPTTVLTYQQHRKLVERFAEFPVTVAMLSRFSSSAEARAVKDGLARGTIDVVVGTHALLGRDLRYARLGMVVVDEEHRFGVKQKARFQKLRTEVDLLSMSATPIPRTMQMALSGLRSMSIMATPPDERLEIRTSLGQWNRTRVRDALLHELERKGQAYVVHNRVESIGRVADEVRAWVPEARVEVAHGQMNDEALEEILLAFMEGRFDVLVCTAIVESGVDLPNVNTMLIHRADLFGLSQLHQLRGRVGRASARGNCVLMVPEDLSRDARKRLGVLVENTRLGSGFAIAAADLEMRGSGNLLGEAQSGNIDAVGYHVWVELLEEAVHAARGNVDRDRVEPEVELPLPAFLPETLIPDVEERMGWYRRLAAARRESDVDELIDDLRGEHGDLPEEVIHLAGRLQIGLVCRRLGITRVSWLKVRALIEFHAASPVAQNHLEVILAEHPKRLTVEAGRGGERRLGVRFTPTESERPVHFLRWMLARIERELRVKK